MIPHTTAVCLVKVSSMVAMVSLKNLILLPKILAVDISVLESGCGVRWEKVRNDVLWDNYITFEISKLS